MVADQSSGLRFDIYERVTLSEEVEGIQELDEIELIPRIELTTQDEQAILKGNLLLKGTYIGGKDQRSSQRLEHSIPVEITLPKERIHDYENIGVEIENFDVDVTSARNLSVTGVLSLKGVEVNTGSDKQWNEEEETVFVHRVEENEQDQSDSNETFDSFEENLFDQQPEEEQQEEEKSGLKIAFNSQQTADSSEDFQYKDVNALLHSQRDDAQFPLPADETVDRGNLDESHTEVNQTEGRQLGARQSAESQVDEGQSNVDAGSQDQSNSEVEWKNLFLNRDGEETQFSKMRMCIVQKQDTLDAIAERYSLNPREIVLFNRLSDQEVAEGQILYIPS